MFTTKEVGFVPDMYAARLPFPATEPQPAELCEASLPGPEYPPDSALGTEATRADHDQQDDVKKQLEGRSACFAPAAEGERNADISGCGDGGDRDEYPR
jgi:hypothetical protein